MQIVDGLRDDGLAADVPGGVRADGAWPQVLFHERAQRSQQHDRHGKEQRDLQPELGMQQGGCQSGQCAADEPNGRQGRCGALDAGKDHDERKPQELHAHGIFLLSLLSV